MTRADAPGTAGALRARHVPQRTCVACRKVRAKRDLVRLVRGAAGDVTVDLSGRRVGRGVYLCRSRSCWELALKKNRLEAAFRAKIEPGSARRLLEYVETLPPAPEEQES